MEKTWNQTLKDCTWTQWGEFSSLSLTSVSTSRCAWRNLIHQGVRAKEPTTLSSFHQWDKTIVGHSSHPPLLYSNAVWTEQLVVTRGWLCCSHSDIFKGGLRKAALLPLICGWQACLLHQLHTGGLMVRGEQGMHALAGVSSICFCALNIHAQDRLNRAAKRATSAVFPTSPKTSIYTL